MFCLWKKVPLLIMVFILLHETASCPTRNDLTKQNQLTKQLQKNLLTLEWIYHNDRGQFNSNSKANSPRLRRMESAADVGDQREILEANPDLDEQIENENNKLSIRPSLKGNKTAPEYHQSIPCHAQENQQVRSNTDDQDGGVFIEQI